MWLQLETMNKTFNRTLTLPKYSIPAGDLPAPHWSPNGEEGYWVFRNERWSWLNDEEYKQLKEEEND